MTAQKLVEVALWLNNQDFMLTVMQALAEAWEIIADQNERNEIEHLLYVIARAIGRANSNQTARGPAYA